MNYSALIEGRRSVRAFLDKAVPEELILEILEYHDKSCKRLAPDIDTALLILDESSQSALEGTAGYKQFLIGAPHYLLLLSDRGPHMGLNAGYMMEDMILKLEDMGLNSCWLTFTDGAAVSSALGISPFMEVAAIAAFGYGKKVRRELQLNVISMSNVDIAVKRHYYDPNNRIQDMVYYESWGSREGLDEHMGFYGDILWDSFYAASQSPSYLNRQPYGFLIRGHEIMLVSVPDEHTDEYDGQLNLGIALLHFGAVAAQWVGSVQWQLDGLPADVELPEGHAIAALCRI